MKCSVKEPIPCKVKCPDECKTHEYGYNCENQNCTVGPWSDKYDNPCKKIRLKFENDQIVCSKKGMYYTQKAITKSYRRERKVLVTQKGDGDPCPKLWEITMCKYPACIRHGPIDIISSWFRIG